MPKNIIICCDGTGNQFGDRNSNVVKLYSVVKKLPGEQIAYYDPGLGTTSYSGFGTSFAALRSRIFGLAGGAGIYQNVAEAYTYLMNHYEAGDRVYLFGFSRGAYTVRVLSGFIRMMGLLERGCENLIPYAFELYTQRPADFRTAGRFKSQFSRKCPVAFMGLWDTVSSVGYFWNFKSYPYTAKNDNVAIVRHAIAIDERRAFYQQNKLLPLGKKKQSLKEVWFAGVHSDVGGSYAESESGLSKLTLQWMINEAAKAGLIIKPGRYARVVHGRGSGDYVGPDPCAPIHRSLKGIWYALEIIPQAQFDYGKKLKRWVIPWGSYREIPEGAVIHASVLQRMEQTDYRPPNLPEHYTVEPIEDGLLESGG